MTTVRVTAEHIAAGTPGECRECPIALAILSAFPHVTGVSAGTAEISIRHSGTDSWVDFDTPREVRFFILTFDNGRPVEPFSFDLDYPQEVAA